MPNTTDWQEKEEGEGGRAAFLPYSQPCIAVFHDGTSRLFRGIQIVKSIGPSGGVLDEF